MPQQKFKTENYANFNGINTKASPYITGAGQVLDLSNFDFTTPGSLTKREGSTQYLGATVQGAITGLYEFIRLDGSSAIIATANTNAYSVTNAFTAFKTGMLNGAITDFITFVDRLFVANGQDFFKYDLTTPYLYGLPSGSTASVGSGASGTGSMTGTYIYSYGYLNERGFLGPVGPGFTATPSNSSGVTLTGFTTPSGYGITAIAIYRSGQNLTDRFQIGFAAAGASVFSDTNLPLLTTAEPTYVWFTLIPRYIEIYNNQLFMAGFSSQPSNMWFSDIGEPEGVNADFNIEVRTNDGDKITGMKTYFDSLMVFKEFSFHQLRGDNPDNFLLREVSSEYGCLSNRAAVVWENYLWFLDRKGIVEYNGANIQIVSNQIEPILTSMNIDAAKMQATAIHNRLRNEVWFSIPTNGATLNNTTIVYDYLSKAWTKFEGFQPSSVSYMRGRFTSPVAYYGTYSGSIMNFGASLFGDNGAGMTCLIKTRFHAELGQSTEKMYRRLFLNVDVTGITAAINVDLYSNYGSSAVVTQTMYQAPFQSRIDFGVSAKSVAARFTSFQNNAPVRIHGYTFDYREQRRV